MGSEIHQERWSSSFEVSPQGEGSCEVRNTWKGLIIGGLTGVGAGAVLDLFGDGSRLARATGWRAVRATPVVADRIKSAADAGATRIHEADISEHVKEVGEQVNEILHRVGDAAATDHVRETIERVARKGAELAHTVMGSGPPGSH